MKYQDFSSVENFVSSEDKIKFFFFACEDQQIRSDHHSIARIYHSQISRLEEQDGILKSTS